MNPEIKSLALKALLAIKHNNEVLARSIYSKVYQDGEQFEPLTDAEILYLIGFPAGCNPSSSEIIEALRSNIDSRVKHGLDVPIYTGMIII